MSDRDYGHRSSRDGVTIPTIWLAVALSILLHIVVLWHWLPQWHVLSLNGPQNGRTSTTLAVQLLPPTSKPSPSPSASASPAQPARPPSSRPPRQKKKATARRPSPPQVIALKRQARDTPPPARSTATPAPPVGDLASYIEAKRRARADAPSAATPPRESSTSAVEDDDARTKRIVAANLGLGNTPGGDEAHGGGIFQIKRIGYSDAEFMFFGWHSGMRHKLNQLVEVRKGNNSDIRIAVVRKIITIIRQYESADFRWESRRLDREITLSARPADSAELEEFMMKEFFDPARQP